MNILIPMAGEGRRFITAGYDISKPAIPTTSLIIQEKIPMVVAAALHIPQVNTSNIIFVDRDYHKSDGLEERILKYFPNANFITIDYLTEGQAKTCLLAKKFINNDEELFIGACDNGMIINDAEFTHAKSNVDAIIITHTNDTNIESNPFAHSWIHIDNNKNVQNVSIKQTISNKPMLDHATTGMFWFKRGSDFIQALEDMISQKDNTGGEYYVDQAIQYALQNNLRIKIFDVKYLCWGTAKDYEDYENTIKYWKAFIQNEKLELE